MAKAYQNLAIDSPAPRVILSRMVLAELANFVSRHRVCGQLTGDATEP